MKTPSIPKRLLLFCYESLRLFFIFTFRPEFDIDILPASWYMAAPLLILPLALVALRYQTPMQEEKEIYGSVYAASKFLSVAGFFPFTKATFVCAFENAEMTSYYSLKRMGILLIFLAIDAILAAFLLLDKEEKGKSDADNSNS